MLEIAVVSAREHVRSLRKLATGYRWRAQWVVPAPLPTDYEPALVETIKRVRRRTMTTPPRIAALCDAVEYIVRGRVDGDIVECGVWRGGSMMAAAITLVRLGSTDHKLLLFDTFSGMPAPTGADVDSAYDGYSLERRWRRKQRGSVNSWSYASVEDVREALLSTGYPAERVALVKGRVENTIPASAPKSISLLRLDTDWYESTRHELEHLYPRLVPGGILIVDDYGHYEGVRRAVEEYFAERSESILLSRIDYTGRIAVKQ